ncbi:MAG: Ham1-like protein [Acidobacteriales bacterium]|nr:Ham1-like protein [Terriglobales bacterium]
MNSPLVTLWRFRDLSEAQLAKGKLEASGIECHLADENMVSMYWLYSNVIGGVRLQVPQHQAERALELLQEPIPETLNTGDSGLTYIQPRCPNCNSLDVSCEGSDNFVTYGASAFGFPIRVASNNWHCAKCSHDWETISEPDPLHPAVAAETMTRIFVATSNKGKLKDFAAAARTLDIDIAALPGFDNIPEVIEDGDTFEANARKKAEVYSSHLPNELVIADDSGLEVDALGGAPGVHSARFAASAQGKKPSDSDNNYKLINELSLRPGCERTARFVCVIALARNGELVATFRGEAYGEILQMPIGRHGFGYDPLFYVPELNKTFAEMNAEERAAYSHRGAAFKKLLDWLKR